MSSGFSLKNVVQVGCARWTEELTWAARPPLTLLTFGICWTGRSETRNIRTGRNLINFTCKLYFLLSLRDTTFVSSAGGSRQRLKTPGNVFAECYPRHTSLGIIFDGKQIFAKCHLLGTRQRDRDGDKTVMAGLLNVITPRHSAQIECLPSVSNSNTKPLPSVSSLTLGKNWPRIAQISPVC